MSKLTTVLFGLAAAAFVVGGGLAFAASRPGSNDHGWGMMGDDHGSWMSGDGPGSMMGSRSRRGYGPMGGAWSSTTSAPAPIDGAREVTVTMDELAFTPSTMTVQPDEAVNVIVRNTDEVVYDFTLPALGVHVVVQAGEDATFGLRAPAAGSYPFWCSVAGHAQAGMTGTVRVSS